MSKIKLLFILLLLMSSMLSSLKLSAGNGNRAGQAGATELLLNPWARSAGWAGSNSASVRGLEASFLNIAGIAFTPKTELAFSNTSWLTKAAGININAFGFTQRVGEAGVMGFNIVSMNFGDNAITTVDIPEGGIGKFSPQFMNLGLSYAKAFSNSIYGGLNVKIISESISNVSANGVAFDAGIQYVTGVGKNKDGKKNTDNLKFGLSLKNVEAAPMRFSGDGLSGKGSPLSNPALSLTLEQRSEKFEIPSLMNIGAAYDYKVSDMHRFTFAATFTSNSFTTDQYLLGGEYGFKSLFMMRVGYLYEQQRTTMFTGLCAGFTIEMPLGKGGKTLGLDYSFRETSLQGTHSIGARINL